MLTDERNTGANRRLAIWRFWAEFEVGFVLVKLVFNRKFRLP